MADFNALSNELRILIIEHINDLPTTAESDDECSVSECPVDPNYRLPKVNTSLLHLSRVNHNLHTLVEPYLFRNVILRNSVESGDSVGLIATSDRAKYVRRLGFVGTSVIPSYPPEYRRTYELRDVELPATVRQILSNLDCFPALEGVDVWFALKQDSESGLREYEGGYFSFYDVFKYENPRKPFLLDDVFLALAYNQPKVVKELKVYNFIPDFHQGLCHHESHAFLGQLSSFGMQLCADWQEVRKYGEYTEEAVDLLWGRLHNMTHLSIAAGPQGGLLGSKPLLYLADAPLPNLTSIAFDYIWVGDDLLNTLLEHTGTLRSVRLDHVFVPRLSRTCAGDYIHTTWAEFFGKLDNPSSSFSSLIDFEVLCTGDWNGLAMETGKQQRARDKERQRLLGEGTPELRYCLENNLPSGWYTEFDIKEQEDPGCVIDASEDRLAYDRFMETVKSNRARLGIA